MKPVTKIVSIPISIYLLTSLCGCTPSAVINTKYVQLFSATSEIADFDLPDGYSTDFRDHFLGYSVVAYSAGDGHSHLYLIQSDNKDDSEKLPGILGQIAPGSYDPQTRMKVIETHPVTVCVQEDTLVTSEGTNSEGEIYRQAALVFQFKTGPALLVLSEPVTNWDQELVDAFIYLDGHGNG